MNPRQIRFKFEWDSEKDLRNQQKHRVAFRDARRAFADPNRIIYEDMDHSTPTETRYFCVGLVENRVMTVRFTLRNRRIRIFGAGYWRKERKLYEERNR
jgi:uncharacterized DUF497 family protein